MGYFNEITTTITRSLFRLRVTLLIVGKIIYVTRKAIIINIAIDDSTKIIIFKLSIRNRSRASHV